MTTSVLPVSPRADVGDELVHLTCCRADDPGKVALCGTDVANDQWVDDAATCVVCADMETDCDGDYNVCPFMAPFKGAGR